jgi:hypothetical protein
MQPIHKKNGLLQRGSVLVLLASLTISAALVDGEWGEEPAAMTVSEFLELQFRTSMEIKNSTDLNSFSVVRFCPSSDPQSAVVFVMQTWRDERLETPDLRREIRKVGDALTAQFEAMVRSPRISKRWRVENPKANFIIKHVRRSDLRETLSATIDGVTVFSGEDIAKAKAKAISRGARWSW